MTLRSPIAKWPGLAVAASLAMALPLAASADDEKRPVPDYDGRPAEGPNVGEVLIWVPRIVLLPGYVVTEYVIRQPIGAFVTWLEREKVVQQAYGIFTFGSGGRFGVFPTGLFDFGLRPSVGIYTFVDPLFHPDNRFRISAAYGGDDWLSIGAKDRVILEENEGGELSLRGGYARRPDYPFYGIGPDARTEEDETYYRLSRWEVALSLAMGREHFGFKAEAFVRADERDDSDFGRSTIELFPRQYFDDADIADFRSGTTAEQRLEIYLDTRTRGPTFLGSGTGARLDLRGGFGFDPDDVETERWIRYGGEASLFLDLTGTRRVLGVNALLEAVDALGGDELPLGALPSLGGLETMRAFYQDRFLGRSVATASLEYRWPVASFLDAELFCSVGNAFGERWEDFEVEKLAGSGGLALRTNTSRDLSFDILIGAGTRQFDQGPLEIESFRFAIGTNRGF